MRIPVTNLKPSLASVEPQWRANLERLLEKSDFILGAEGAAFEAEFAAAMGASEAVGVANGTNAIELALRDAGVRGEVITTALTAPFTAVAIRAAGCTPRFADVEPHGLQIDVHDLERRMTERTEAIVAVHLYGQPCNLNEVQSLALRRGAVLIQDACQAHGANYRGEPLTVFSKYVCYSFYPTKNLGCLGDGGAITTDDGGVAARLRSERNGGRGSRPQVAERWGMNSRLDEMQCCYLRALLPRLPEMNAERARLADLYDQGFAGCDAVRPLSREGSVNHLYVVRVLRRDGLRGYLESHGIGTGIHYPAPLHLHPAFADCGLKAGDLPQAERACGEIVSLPLWPGLSDGAVSEVIERVHQFYA